METLVVKFNDAYLSDRLNLPPVVHHTHDCKRPYYLHVMNDVVSDNVLSHMHGNDMFGAMESLGCSSSNPNRNIISGLLTQLHERLLKHRLKQDYLTQVRSSVTSSTNDKELDAKIEKNDRCVQHVSEQIRTIHDRVNDIVNDEVRHVCPICMETVTPTSACIFSCCLNLYCSSCVKKVVDYEVNQCPLCRTPIVYKNIFKIPAPASAPAPGNNKPCDTLPDKNDMLLKLIVNIHHESSDYHIVVFAMYEESILSVQSTLYKSMIQFRTLRGNNMQSTLQWFHDTKAGVMIVNAQLHGNGLNLVDISHMIMYQTFAPDLTMQLIGRAHRIGKTNELHVHTLQYF
jgi:SNF2 family DNA or RNA helicase